MKWDMELRPKVIRDIREEFNPALMNTVRKNVARQVGDAGLNTSFCVQKFLEKEL